MDIDTRQLLARIFREKTPKEKETRDLVQKYLGEVLSFRETESGCIELFSDKTVSNSGYSYAGTRANREAIHRIVFFMAYPETDKKLSILHRCDNKKCARLDHLFVGTQAINMQDCIDKGRFPRGVNSVCAKLTEQQVLEIRQSKESMKTLAIKYNVGTSTIFRAKNKQTYFTVEEKE